MNNDSDKVVIARMEPQQKLQWDKPGDQAKRKNKKQLPRNARVAAAVSLCLGAGAFIYSQVPMQGEAVMSHLTAGFEYDETLGRLQYVSNILPESAMVFLQTAESENAEQLEPVSAQAVHAWTCEEPWIEYNADGDVVSCQAGDVMTIVSGSKDTYTIRLRHESGYESLYSGLSSVKVSEGDSVYAGEALGEAGGFAAFELRKDGLSIQPSFAGS